MDANTTRRRLTVGEQLVLSVMWFSLNTVSAALLPIVIPTQILLFVSSGKVGSTQQAAFLGALSTLGAIVSLFVPPLIGMLSDRTSSVYGRRRPFIVLGAGVMLLAAPLLATAGSAAIFVVGLAILQIGNNVLTASYQSLTPDLVPGEQRGEASGYMGVMTILGNVVSLGLAAWLFRGVNALHIDVNVIRTAMSFYYPLTIGALLVGVLITIIGVHEKPGASVKTEQSGVQERRMLRLQRWFVRSWIEPWREYNFTLVFLTRFCVMMGLALFLTFIEYYFARVSGNTNFVQTTASVAVLALLGAVVSAFALGVLSDRTRRAPVVSLATLCMSLAALAFVVLPSSFALWPLGILFGLGYGAYTSVDWALSVDALPSLEAAGKDLGIWSASATLPAIFAPLVGGLIIFIAGLFHQDVLGYRLVFATATLFLLTAAVCVLFVREKRS